MLSAKETKMWYVTCPVKGREKNMNTVCVCVCTHICTRIKSLWRDIQQTVNTICLL